MKKRIIALGVAAAMGGFVGPAIAAPAADHLEYSEGGVGHILYVPYFSTQAGNVTALNIVNTDTVNGKVVKIRFRGASNSDDIYDFQVFLSPGDVWTAGISKGSDGRSRLDTVDNSCTLPSKVSGAFILGRTYSGATDRADETREGYVEILTMADIVKGASGTNKLALYNATKHSKDTVACTSSVLTALTNGNATDYMDPPTTGLMANWTIINVAKVVAYSGAATAIEARAAGNVPGAGKLVYWDQRSTSLTPAEVLANTADPLFLDGAVAGARYDLPDMSTPYVAGYATPQAQATILSNALATVSAAMEFYNEASVGAATDWVISFPTRRYFAAVDYEAAKGPEIVYGLDSANVYFNPDNTELGSAANGGKSYQICSILGTKALAFWNREETPTIVDDIVISPGTPQALSLCGEVSVLGINAATPEGSATFGQVARANASNGFKEGWGKFTVPPAANNVSYGLPFLAREFRRVNNTQTNVYYGMSFPARILSKGANFPQ